jgi:hypothetical protein
LQGHDHFYGQGSSPSIAQPCPLWTNSITLHGQELAQAAKRAKQELAADNIRLKAGVLIWIICPGGRGEYQSMRFFKEK